MTTIDHRRRSVSGAAKQTTLAARMLDSDTTATLLDGSTFPSAPSSKFAIVTIDRGESNEERIAYSPRVGNDLQNCVRGADGTTAYTHEAGATVEHSIGAIDIDEANELVAAFSVANAAAANALVTATNSAWTSWTPTLRVLDGGGAVNTLVSAAWYTAGGAAKGAEYRVVGNVCTFEIYGYLILSGTQAFCGLEFSLPVPTSSSPAYSVGMAGYGDAFNAETRLIIFPTTALAYPPAGYGTTGQWPVDGGHYTVRFNGQYRIA